MNKTITILAKDLDNNLRLDKFLTNNLKTISRSQIKKIIMTGGVSIDTKKVLSASEKIKSGNQIKIVIGDNKGDQHAYRHTDKRVFYCIPKNQPEILISEDLDIVLHPDCFLRAEKVPFQRGYIKCFKCRIKPDCYIEEQRNGQKKPSCNRKLLLNC